MESIMTSAQCREGEERALRFDINFRCLGSHARMREVRIKYGGEATTRKLLYAMHWLLVG
jgi:hypothetical protein